jgi:Na+-driven multidrug efflux pump
MFEKEITEFRLFRFKNFSREEVTKIITLSLPLIVQNLLSMGAWFVFFVFIEKIGAHELALSNVVRGSYMISMTPFWGFSVSANSMVSNIIGQGRKDEVMILLNRIIRLTMLVAVIMILINLLFPKQILGIFTNDEQLIQDSLRTLQVVDVALIFFSFAIVSINAVSGTGATRMALYIEILSIFIYLLYIYLFTFVFKGSVESVWCSEIIYWLFAGAACYWYLRSGIWKKLNSL